MRHTWSFVGKLVAPLLGWVLLAGLCGAGCGPRFKMDPPPGFKEFQHAGRFKMITADGVMLSARHLENYPRADLPFWTDALKRHLLQRGYAFSGETCFQTASGLDGCMLDFLLPFGAEDWVLSETVFVRGEQLVLVEAAGPYDRYSKLAPGLKTAIRTFRVED